MQRIKVMLHFPWYDSTGFQVTVSPTNVFVTAGLQTISG
jgi:hypothetical protein